MQEEWRDIPGYAGYQASSLGRIRSVDRLVRYTASRRAAAYSVLKKGRVLKPAPQNNPAISGKGHLMVMAGRGRNLMVHTAVALAFIGPRPADREVRHLDGNPAHNAPPNLQYGTRTENLVDIFRHGGRKLSRDDILAIRAARDAGVGSRQLARLYGVNSGQVWLIGKRRQYAHV